MALQRYATSFFAAALALITTTGIARAQTPATRAAVAIAYLEEVLGEALSADEDLDRAIEEFDSYYREITLHHHRLHQEIPGELATKLSKARNEKSAAIAEGNLAYANAFLAFDIYNEALDAWDWANWDGAYSSAVSGIIIVQGALEIYDRALKRMADVNEELENILKKLNPNNPNENEIEN